MAVFTKCHTFLLKQTQSSGLKQREKKHLHRSLKFRCSFQWYTAGQNFSLDIWLCRCENSAGNGEFTSSKPSCPASYTGSILAQTHYFQAGKCICFYVRKHNWVVSALILPTFSGVHVWKQLMSPVPEGGGLQSLMLNLELLILWQNILLVSYCIRLTFLIK